MWWSSRWALSKAWPQTWQTWFALRVLGPLGGGRGGRGGRVGRSVYIRFLGGPCPLLLLIDEYRISYCCKPEGGR
ncbi:hypothetical protein CONLIGDRAFT_422669 [Coniochaeta ligniaria NRRL 30616]|uniref:Secreted protein n=1 Tax=Coniochaeta ligniaria NRRL 30616 TaxID=1408157 RepID=A0A1J7JDI6_9PEZI|nr:hypothetical protein CONLIGDRAFT_422669 [Coniochaeta ligniaria NRRL 30616]